MLGTSWLEAVYYGLEGAALHFLLLVEPSPHFHLALAVLQGLGLPLLETHPHPAVGQLFELLLGSLPCLCDELLLAKSFSQGSRIRNADVALLLLEYDLLLGLGMDQRLTLGLHFQLRSVFKLSIRLQLLGLCLLVILMSVVGEFFLAEAGFDGFLLGFAVKILLQDPLIFSLLLAFLPFGHHVRTAHSLLTLPRGDVLILVEYVFLEDLLDLGPILLLALPQVFLQIVRLEGGFGDDLSGECLHQIEFLLHLAVGVVEQFLADGGDGLLVVLVGLAGHLSDCALADALCIFGVEGFVLELRAGLAEGVVGDLHGEIEEGGFGGDVFAEGVVMVLGVFGEPSQGEIVIFALVIHPLSII